MPTISALPTSASAMPPFSPNSGFGFVKNVEVQRLSALVDD